MENPGEISAHFTTAAAAIYAIEFLKQWHAFRWLTADTKTVARVVNIVSAGLIALGISWSYDAAHHQITIGWGQLAGSGYEWLKQFLAQQILYDSILQKRAVTVRTGPAGEQTAVVESHN